jgi:RimJ/RimL family protein N-acetyltransferase
LSCSPANTVELRFRPYEDTDRSACLALFDANCPEYFAPNERSDYAQFLEARRGNYDVCLLGDSVVGAYGLYPLTELSAALHWILLSPSVQGHGLGSAIMTRVMSEMKHADHSLLRISASHRSAPFFSRFGAVELSTVADGWGPGMHRVEMYLSL